MKDGSQRIETYHDSIAENSMFSSDVRLFFGSQPTTAKLQQGRLPSLWQQRFFLQAGPGCIHGEAACSYNITAHLIVEYYQG